MKSEYNILVHLLNIVLVIVGIVIGWQLITVAGFNFGHYSLTDWILAGISAAILLFALLHTVLMNYSVTVTDMSIIYSWRFLPGKKSVSLAQLDGYVSMRLPSRYDRYLTFYPVRDGRVHPSLSTFYFENAEKLMKQSGLKFLGEIPFGWRCYLAEIVLLRKISRTR